MLTNLIKLTNIILITILFTPVPNLVPLAPMRAFNCFSFIVLPYDRKLYFRSYILRGLTYKTITRISEIWRKKHVRQSLHNFLTSEVKSK